MKVKWFLMWFGGRITGVFGAGLIFGLFTFIYGVTPGQFFADLLAHLPHWATSPLSRLIAVIFGLFVIFIFFHYNRWSLRQRAIDDLAEEISWAITYLLNRPVNSDEEVDQWHAEYQTWCNSVSEKLENRAFFTRADQLHFNRLGFVDMTPFAGSHDQRHRWLISQLRLKFERLRDVINWTQMRRR